MEQSKLHILYFQIKIFRKECEIKPKVLNYSFCEDPVFKVRSLRGQRAGCCEHLALKERLCDETGAGAVTASAFDILHPWHSEINCCYQRLSSNIREWQIISWFPYFYYR